MSAWRDWLIDRLGGTRPRGSYVVDAEWERSEELRVDRHGPTEEMIKREDPTWQPPLDAERPSSTLGPL